MNRTKIRVEFECSLDHIEQIWNKLKKASGKRRVFTFPDEHKLSEGLFLAAWTHWEQFLRELFIEDLASDSKSALRREVKTFRTKNAPERLAELVIGHPDTRRWVEWSEFGDVIRRADSLLGSTHRFKFGSPQQSKTQFAINKQDLDTLRRIRNALAHKSDVAWRSFRTLVTGPKGPFKLKGSQLKGITVGRFLTAHKWNGDLVIEKSLKLLKSYAKALLP